LRRIAIIGAGPAGCAAAIQLKRFGYEVLLFEADRIGGLLRNANFVENYLGFPDGISGKQLCELFDEHLKNLNIDVIYEKVNSIDFSKSFIIHTEKLQYYADFCIIATGTKPIKIDDSAIEGDTSNKIFYEIKNLPHKLSNYKIAIIGSGDAAFDYALSLSENNEIDILMRSEYPKCIQTLLNKCNSMKNISVIKNISLINILGKNQKLFLFCKKGNDLIYLTYDYLIIAIGREKNLPILSKDANKCERLFLIGDVSSEKNFRQASIAAGEGISIAMKINFLIRSKL